MNLSVLNSYREVSGPWRTKPDDRFGRFLITNPYQINLSLRVVCSPLDGLEEWEHVSVSTAKRTPTWEEMCFVKDLFWTNDEVVFQLHPKKSEYINNHAHCLHLWRNTKAEVPQPPSALVGIKGLTGLEKI